MYGFVPYGRSIEGNMHFVDNLCTISNSGKRIIITRFSTECNVKQQFLNAQEALAIIFEREGLNQISILSEQYSERGTVLNMFQKDIKSLKKTPDSTITLKFRIMLQKERPFIEYIIYEVMQQTQVLKLVEEFQNKGFDLDLDIVYYTTQQLQIYQLCNYQSQGIPAEQENFIYLDGHKLDCRSDFETNYVIVGDLGKTMSRRQILEENVRQVCIKQIYSFEIWKQYRSGFVSTCQQLKEFAEINQCSILLRQQLQIVEEYVQNCYNSSFENNYQSNTILDKQFQLSKGLSSTHFRERATLVVNGDRIYGNYTFDINKLFDPDSSSLFLAICNSYYEQSRPQICNQSTQTYCDWKCEVRAWLTWFDTIMIILIILLLAVVCYFIKHKRTKIDEPRLITIEIQETPK